MPEDLPLGERARENEGVESPTPPDRSPTPPHPTTGRLGRSRRRWGCIIAALIFVGLPILSLGIAMIAAGVSSTGPRIALIRVTGVITAGTGARGLGAEREAGSERIVQQLEKARKDRNVKGIILRINSPGGSPAGSQEIYDEIRRVRRSGKPVYVSMGDVAASGGYYIAAAADRIYADPATATGSIGVIMSSLELGELMDKLGIDAEVMKSGQFKDMGSPFRPLTPAEKRIIQGMIDDIFRQFLDAVSEGRKMPLQKVRALATGRIYTGRQAKALGLVDELGGLRETEIAIGQATKLGPEPKIEVMEKPGLADILFGSEGISWPTLRLPVSRVPRLE